MKPQDYNVGDKVTWTKKGGQPQEFVISRVGWGGIGEPSNLYARDKSGVEGFVVNTAHKSLKKVHENAGEVVAPPAPPARAPEPPAAAAPVALPARRGRGSGCGRGREQDDDDEDNDDGDGGQQPSARAGAKKKKKPSDDDKEEARKGLLHDNIAGDIVQDKDSDDEKPTNDASAKAVPKEKPSAKRAADAKLDAGAKADAKLDAGAKADAKPDAQGAGAKADAKLDAADAGAKLDAAGAGGAGAKLDAPGAGATAFRVGMHVMSRHKGQRKGKEFKGIIQATSADGKRVTVAYYKKSADRKSWTEVFDGDVDKDIKTTYVKPFKEESPEAPDPEEVAPFPYEARKLQVAGKNPWTVFIGSDGPARYGRVTAVVAVAPIPVLFDGVKPGVGGDGVAMQHREFKSTDGSMLDILLQLTGDDATFATLDADDYLDLLADRRIHTATVGAQTKEITLDLTIEAFDPQPLMELMEASNYNSSNPVTKMVVVAGLPRVMFAAHWGPDGTGNNTPTQSSPWYYGSDLLLEDLAIFGFISLAGYSAVVDKKRFYLLPSCCAKFKGADVVIVDVLLAMFGSAQRPQVSVLYTTGDKILMYPTSQRSSAVAAAVSEFVCDPMQSLPENLSAEIVASKRSEWRGNLRWSAETGTPITINPLKADGTTIDSLFQAGGKLDATQLQKLDEKAAEWKLRKTALRVTGYSARKPAAAVGGAGEGAAAAGAGTEAGAGLKISTRGSKSEAKTPTVAAQALNQAQLKALAEQVADKLGRSLADQVAGQVAAQVTDAGNKLMTQTKAVVKDGIQAAASAASAASAG